MHVRIRLGRKLRARRLRGDDRPRLRLDLVRFGIEYQLTASERAEIEQYVMGTR